MVPVVRSPALTNKANGIAETMASVGSHSHGREKEAVGNETLSRAQPELGKAGLLSQARVNVKGTILDHTVED